MLGQFLLSLGKADTQVVSADFQISPIPFRARDTSSPINVTLTPILLRTDFPPPLPVLFTEGPPHLQVCLLLVPALLALLNFSFSLWALALCEAWGSQEDPRGVGQGLCPILPLSSRPAPALWLQD